MAASMLALVLLTFPTQLQAARGLEASLAAAGANPIRKVVTMLQAMHKKVTEEGEKEKELYEKFMCYCKNNGGDLTLSISAADAKIASLSSEIKTAEEQKVQVDEDLKQAQADRAAAKDAVAEATAIREKEAAVFAAEKAEYEANIGAIQKAVAALERGMAGGFLQTSAAAVLRRLAAARHDSLAEEDRQALLAFLEQGSGYAPQSGSIMGILKQCGDEMQQSLSDATATEDAAVKSYEELTAAKKKEIAALTRSIEAKMKRSGELAMSIVQMKNGLDDTEESLLADKEFLADLEKDCATKTSEWEEIVKTRAEELVAISETIKVLNDDDALELFKKTLPSSASSSFVQLHADAVALRQRALAGLREATGAFRPNDRARLDLLVLALRGQKVGFEQVIKMIDGMVETLKQEQLDDDHKKEYCGHQLDTADDQKKDLEHSLEDRETAIASAEEGIASLKEEIATLEAGIKSLDKAVLQATEQRKEEHEEFTSLMASNSAAKELLGFAKNRLYKFYNPKLHKPAAKQELSREDRIVANMGGAVLAQVSRHGGHRNSAAPPPPPETFGAYAKKGEESRGVIAMINLLIQDLDKEMTEAETAEKDAQADYQAMMRDSAAKRAADSKLLTEKGTTKATVMEQLAGHKDKKDSATKELAAALRYIQSLHSECDWLLKYFDVRKEARASEIDALGKAKAILSGSDFAYLQTKAHGFLGRSEPAAR